MSRTIIRTNEDENYSTIVDFFPIQITFYLKKNQQSRKVSNFDFGYCVK